MAKLFFLLPLLLLTACGDDSQARAIAAQECNNETLAKPVAEFNSYMLSCMKARGFVYDGKREKCNLSEIPEESPNCYRKAD